MDEEVQPDLTPPTPEEWRAAGIEEVLEKAEEPTYFDQNQVLRAAERAARAEGDIGRARALALAADVMSMMLRTENGRTTLFPFFIGGGRSSARVDAFSEEQIALLSEVADEVRDVEMRARVADLLWSRKPMERWATMAASAYVASLRRLALIVPLEFEARLDRALEIARTIRRDRAPLAELEALTTSFIRTLSTPEHRWCSIRIAEIALRHKVGDREQIYSLLISEAERYGAASDFLASAGYYRVAISYAKALGDVEKEKRAIRGQAESVLSEAKPFEDGSPTGALMAESRYEDAIGIYRRRASTFGAEIEALKRRLVELQELGLGALSTMSVETPVSAEMIEFVNATRGLPLPEALHRIAMRARPGDLVAMRENVLERFKSHPAMSMFGTRLLKENGLTDAEMTRLPLGEHGPKAEEDFKQRVREEMLRDRASARELTAQLLIEPMRAIVAEENEIQRIDFSALFEGNAFVPDGRREIFQKGVVYGLLGDYMLAASLLVPQIENSIRHLMRAEGLVTSKFNKDGIQDELNLIELLTKEEHRAGVVGILGEGLTFELESLLVSRFGTNLRNLLAHGMAGDAALNGPQACFAWAIVLLLLLRYLARPNAANEEGGSAG